MTTVGEINITRTKASRIAEVDFDNIPFGRVFSDHMLVADYSDGTWQSPEIVPYGTLQLAPAMPTLHYGQAIFEGMKAYRNADGKPVLFRARDNFAPHEPLGRAYGDAKGPRRDLSRRHQRARTPRRGLDTEPERQLALFAPSHVRERRLYRCETVRHLQVRHLYLSGREILLGARQALGHARLRSGSRGRRRRSQDGGQLCRKLLRCEASAGSWLRQRPLARWSGSPLHRGMRHDEYLLRH